MPNAVANPSPANKKSRTLRPCHRYSVNGKVSFIKDHNRILKWLLSSALRSAADGGLSAYHDKRRGAWFWRKSAASSTS